MIYWYQKPYLRCVGWQKKGGGTLRKSKQDLIGHTHKPQCLCSLLGFLRKQPTLTENVPRIFAANQAAYSLPRIIVVRRAIQAITSGRQNTQVKRGWN